MAQTRKVINDVPHRVAIGRIVGRPFRGAIDVRIVLDEGVMLEVDEGAEFVTVWLVEDVIAKELRR